MKTLNKFRFEITGARTVSGYEAFLEETNEEGVVWFNCCLPIDLGSPAFSGLFDLEDIEHNENIERMAEVNGVIIVRRNR